MPSDSVLSSSTTSTDGTGSGSSGGTGTGSGSGGSASDSSGTLGTTIQGYQRPPTGVQPITGSSVGSSVNGATSNNPYYRVNPATTTPTGPRLTDTLMQNVVSIGSKFLSNLVNGDPNKIAAEAANPYSSSTYLAQYQAQLAAASAKAAQQAAAARASPVPGSAAYYAAQNNNRGRVTTSAPIGTPTLTPAQIRVAASKASRISDYYKNHPSAGIIGTGLYKVQTTTTTSAPSASTTPDPDQVTDPTTDDEVPGSTDSTSDQETEIEGSSNDSQSDSTGTQALDTTSVSGTIYPGTGGVTDSTLTGTSSTTCQVTALNAGNCNPNFRNKLCDLGCSNNEQAAVSALCQKNACSVGVSLSFFLGLVYPISRKVRSNTNGPNLGNRPDSQLQSDNTLDRLSRDWRNGQRERPEILQQPGTQRSRGSLLHIHRQTSRAQVSHGHHYCSSH